MNRVTASIARAKARIADRMASGAVTEQSIGELHKRLDMNAGEFCRFQELKSVAMLEGKLTQEEAQTIYAMLGNTPEHFNRQPVEVKSTLTQIFGELLEKSMA
jgi:hypothetical protein